MYEDVEQLLKCGQSAYAGMFTLGRRGVPAYIIIDHVTRLGIPLREKDWIAYQEGFAYKIGVQNDNINPYKKQPPAWQWLLNTSFNELEMLHLTPGFDYERRWFPCSKGSEPLMSWGYNMPDRPPPRLTTRNEAMAMTEDGYVGQNTYGQPLVILDIDGVGHGAVDQEVITFGNQFKNSTEVWENPRKPGSFHVYFETDRIIPTKHFEFAKLDLMGNKTNYAVYGKDKVSNNIPRMKLDENIWKRLQNYIQWRAVENNNNE